jgi:hypothetical protein
VLILFALAKLAQRINNSQFFNPSHSHSREENSLTVGFGDFSVSLYKFEVNPSLTVGTSNWLFQTILDATMGERLLGA